MSERATSLLQYACSGVSHTDLKVDERARPAVDGGGGLVDPHSLSLSEAEDYCDADCYILLHGVSISCLSYEEALVEQSRCPSLLNKLIQAKIRPLFHSELD